MTPPGHRRTARAERERILVRPRRGRRWLDEGVFYLVSPLDSANATEVELTEEQESFLTWLQKNNVQHVRLLE